MYLSFDSSDAIILNVTNDGFVVLQGNNAGSEAVLISATAMEDETVSGAIDVFANLDPLCYDVDLGALKGAPLAFDVEDNIFEVPVRIDTCSETLTGFKFKSILMQMLFWLSMMPVHQMTGHTQSHIHMGVHQAWYSWSHLSLRQQTQDCFFLPHSSLRKFQMVPQVSEG
jgi:hypothetical protein